MAMGIWWEKFHSNYVGSEDGGRGTLEEPGGADPGAESQARLTCLRAGQPSDCGAQNSLAARPAFLSRRK